MSTVVGFRKKTKPKNFIQDDEIFYKICRTYSWVYADTTATKHVSGCPYLKHVSGCPYPTRFILIASCRTETETVSRMQKAWPLTVVAAISQWRRRLYACVRAPLTMDILSTICGVLMVQCVKLMLRIFEFGVLLFDCFVYRQNVTFLKRFRRYGHYVGGMEDIDYGDIKLYIIISSIAVVC